MSPHHLSMFAPGYTNMAVALTQSWMEQFISRILSDQRLYRQNPGSEPQAITPEVAFAMRILLLIADIIG